jgi:hypothetical protein
MPFSDSEGQSGVGSPMPLESGCEIGPALGVRDMSTLGFVSGRSEHQEGPFTRSNLHKTIHRQEENNAEKKNSHFSMDFKVAQLLSAKTKFARLQSLPSVVFLRQV